jgi:hypothetical protein
MKIYSCTVNIRLKDPTDAGLENLEKTLAEAGLDPRDPLSGVNYHMATVGILTIEWEGGLREYRRIEEKLRDLGKMKSSADLQF